jgi:hypothetical protein
MTFVDLESAQFLALASAHRPRYQNADPYPHIVFEDFFNAEALRALHADFPSLSGEDAYQFETRKQIKRATKARAGIDGRVRDFVDFLNSQIMLDFLNALTGINEPLIADAGLEGGGCHEIMRGGMLKIHADFSKHPITGLDRRLNLLVYLNEDWCDEYGGALEIWDRDLKACRKRVSPRFNTVCIFSTSATSFHGHPDPLSCPPDRSRRSIALYYYSGGRPAGDVPESLVGHRTLWRNRPGSNDRAESWRKRLKRRLRGL